MQGIVFAGWIRLDNPMENYTKDPGESIRLHCEVTGNPTPKFKWYKNEAPVDEYPRGKIQIRG